MLGVCDSRHLVILGGLACELAVGDSGVGVAPACGWGSRVSVSYWTMDLTASAYLTGAAYGKMLELWAVKTQC